MSRLPPGLEAGLVAVADILAEPGIRWLLVAGAARTLRGAETAPSDLDIEVAGADADAGAERLGLTLGDVPGAMVSSRRAHGLIAGAPVDLSADLVVRGPTGTLAPDFERQWAAGESLRISRRVIRLGPIEEELARAVVAGAPDRALKILAGPDAELLLRSDYLAARLASVS